MWEITPFFAVACRMGGTWIPAFFMPSNRGAGYGASEKRSITFPHISRIKSVNSSSFATAERAYGSKTPDCFLVHRFHATDFCPGGAGIGNKVPATAPPSWSLSFVESRCGAVV
jgi:hypothetical protein